MCRFVQYVSTSMVQSMWTFEPPIVPMNLWYQIWRIVDQPSTMLSCFCCDGSLTGITWKQRCFSWPLWCCRFCLLGWQETRWGRLGLQDPMHGIFVSRAEDGASRRARLCERMRQMHPERPWRGTLQQRRNDGNTINKGQSIWHIRHIMPDMPSRVKKYQVKVRVDSCCV